MIPANQSRMKGHRSGHASSHRSHGSHGSHRSSGLSHSHHSHRTVAVPLTTTPMAMSLIEPPEELTPSSGQSIWKNKWLWIGIGAVTIAAVAYFVYQKKKKQDKENKKSEVLMHISRDL